MKEYLTKNSNGDYQLVNHRFSDDDIEVPHGAERFTKGGFFRDELTWFSIASKKWMHRDEGWCGYNEVLWQREPKYKEFLNKNDNYNLVILPEHAGDDEKSGLIEVPDGAESAYFYSGSNSIEFYKKDLYFDIYDLHWNHCYSNIITGDFLWQRYKQPESLPFIDDESQSINDQYAEIEQVRQEEIHATSKTRENSHYFIDVSDVNEVDFYEIAKRYNVTDPAIQHILKKCLAIGNRGHKDLETDLKDILKTAKRALQINGFGE